MTNDETRGRKAPRFSFEGWKWYGRQDPFDECAEAAEGRRQERGA